MIASKNGILNSVIEILDTDPQIEMKKFCKEELQKLMNIIGNDGWNAFHFSCYYGHDSLV